MLADSRGALPAWSGAVPSRPAGSSRNACRSTAFTSRDTIKGAGSVHPLCGRNVVFTGTLDSMIRADAAQLVDDCGGVVVSSVSTKTDHVVLGEPDFAKFRGKNKSSKLLKAEQVIAQGHPLEIVPESDFLRLVFS